jgi:hypothetical protein
MKNFVTLSLFFIIYSFFLSCNEDNFNLKYKTEINRKIINETNQFDTKIDEFEAMVNSTALSVLELAQLKDFRSEVHQLVNNKFDGDENTLIKHIGDLNSNLVDLMYLNKLKSDNRKLFKVNSLQVEANFPSFSDRKTFEKIINGYNSQDFKWFPQIYIPYFELHKNNLNEIPIIALVLNDEETIPGYTLDNEGNLIVLSINHEFAKQHLVWIISVNERTNNKGEVIRNKNQRINDSQRLEMRSYGTSFWLWTIVLHSPHESWGDSELSVVCRHGNTNCTPNGSLYQILDFKSTHLMEIVHSFGQNDTYLTTTNSFSFPEGLIDYGECYDFIFFEEDPHRNSTEIISSYNSCTPIDNSNRMTIFSYSGPYMHKFHCPPVNNYPLQQQVAAQTYIEPNEADVTVGAIRRN